MATLSAGEIASIIKYYSENGTTPVTDEAGTTFVAIALAESGGNTEAVGGPNTNGTRDWGLFQINDIHNPTERVKHSGAANWIEAWRIAGMGTSFKPWATYNNGKYRDFMNTARSAWGGAAPENVDSTDKYAGVESDPIQGETITQFDGPLAFLNPLLRPDTWVRVGMALGGFVLIALVVGAMMKNASPLGKLANIAKAVK